MGPISASNEGPCAGTIRSSAYLLMLVLGAKLITVLTHERNVCHTSPGLPTGVDAWRFQGLATAGRTGPVRFNPI
jgi:hypothetical protein